MGGVRARLEEYLLPYGSLVWVQVSGGGYGWVCRGRGSWHPLVLVALEGLRVRVRVDRTPGVDVVVALRVLGVEDFKYCAGGVVRWGWADVPGLARVDEPGGGWLVGIGEDVVEVRAEGRWELFRWDPVLSCV